MNIFQVEDFPECWSRKTSKVPTIPAIYPSLLLPNKMWYELFLLHGILAIAAHKVSKFILFNSFDSPTLRPRSPFFVILHKLSALQFVMQKFNLLNISLAATSGGAAPGGGFGLAFRFVVLQIPPTPAQSSQSSQIPDPSFQLQSRSSENGPQLARFAALRIISGVICFLNQSTIRMAQFNKTTIFILTSTIQRSTLGRDYKTSIVLRSFDPLSCAFSSVSWIWLNGLAAWQLAGGLDSVRQDPSHSTRSTTPLAFGV